MYDFKGILIASDLDGTFVNREGKLVEGNLEAVERFKAGGGLFTFATGRVIWSMSSLIPSYQKIVNAPMVLCNGATLYDPVSERDIYAEYLDPYDTLSALEFIKSKFPETRRFVYSGDEYTKQEDTENLEPEQSKLLGWHKMLVLCPAAQMNALEETVTRHFPVEFSYSRSDSNLFELLPPNSTKGKMLGKLDEYYLLQGQKLTIYAVGDYDNDIDMLLSADIACCPETALDSVKAVCDIKLCSCDDGVIADLIKVIENRI